MLMHGALSCRRAELAELYLRMCFLTCRFINPVWTSKLFATLPMKAVALQKAQQQQLPLQLQFSQDQHH
jgi:hypothetical protein